VLFRSLFRFLIQRFNLMTPGREPEVADDTGGMSFRERRAAADVGAGTAPEPVTVAAEPAEPAVGEAPTRTDGQPTG